MASLGDLFITVGAKIDGFKAAMSDVSRTLDASASHATATASKINQVFAAAFGGSMIATAIGSANKFQAAFAQIQRSTGATGEKLDGLEASFTNIYKKTAAGSEQVAAALSVLSARTGATGKDLEDLTLKTLKLAKTQNEDVAQIVPLVTRVFGDWSKATNQQGAAMDYLRIVSQQTGTQVGRIAEQVVSAGAPLRALGYSFEQAAALIGKFEKEGVNTELVLGGMKGALQKFAKDGVTDTAAAWRTFIAGVRDGSVTFQDVMKEVGAKRGVDLFRAITEGRFEIDKMVESSQKLAAEGGAGIETYKTKLIKLQHEVESVVAGHYQLISAVGLGLPVITSMGSAFSGMGVAGIAAITNISSAIRYDMIPALTLLEKGLLFTGVVAAIGAVIANLYLLKKAMDTTGQSTPGRDTAHQFTIGSNGMPSLNPLYIPPSTTAAPAAVAPPPSPIVTPPPALGLSAEDAKKYFQELHLKDLTKELGESVKAFQALSAAGKLTHEQMVQAAFGIQKLRNELAGVKAPIDLVSITQAMPSLEQLQNLPLGRMGADLKDLFDLPQLSAVSRNLDMVAASWVQLGNEENLAARNLQIVADSFGYFGERTAKELADTASESEDQFKIMRDSGTATPEAIGRAWRQMFRDQIAAQRAAGSITEKVYQDLLTELDAQTEKSVAKRTKLEWKAADDMRRAVGGAFDSTYRALAQSTLQWKDWGKNLKNVATNAAEDMLATFLKSLFKPLQDEAVKLAGSLGALFEKGIGGVLGSIGIHLPGVGKDVKAAADKAAAAQKATTVATEANTTATAANTTGEGANTTATVTNTGATVAAASASTAAASTTAVAIREDAVKRKGVAQSVIHWGEDNVKALQDNTAALKDATGSLRDLSGSLKQLIQAENLNTSATNANTGALGSLTAAIWELIRNIGNLNMGGSEYSEFLPVTPPIFSNTDPYFGPGVWGPNPGSGMRMNSLSNDSLKSLGVSIAVPSFTPKPMAVPLRSGDTVNIDLRGAAFGAGVSPSDIDEMFQTAYRRALAAVG